MCIRDSYGIWPNQGQITDLQGNPVPDVSFYTTGSLPRAYFRKDGSFSLVLASVDTTTMADTLRRLDITCVGPEANYPDPIVWEMKQRYANFYFPQCAPNGATTVSYTHLRAHETVLDLVCRLLLEKKTQPNQEHRQLLTLTSTKADLCTHNTQKLSRKIQYCTT